MLPDNGLLADHITILPSPLCGIIFLFIGSSGDVIITGAAIRPRYLGRSGFKLCSRSESSVAPQSGIQQAQSVGFLNRTCVLPFVFLKVELETRHAGLHFG